MLLMHVVISRAFSAYQLNDVFGSCCFGRADIPDPAAAQQKLSLSLLDVASKMDRILLCHYSVPMSRAGIWVSMR